MPDTSDALMIILTALQMLFYIVGTAIVLTLLYGFSLVVKDSFYAFTADLSEHINELRAQSAKNKEYEIFIMGRHRAA